MRVISNKALREFWEIHPAAKAPLEDWRKKISRAAPANFSEMRLVFRAVDYVEGYTVFDVGGNNYRLIAAVHYDKQRLFIRQVMTHAEYDRNDWRKK